MKECANCGFNDEDYGCTCPHSDKWYVEILEELWRYEKTDKYTDSQIREALDMAIKALEQEPKTGHWIEKDGFDGDVYYDCSECGESWTTIDGTPWDNSMNYCPNCGAKMIEPQESEGK